MMHTLMSFIGAIGVTMRCTGLEDIVRAAYGGIAGIMNGKAWPKAMRAFRMVEAALMHGFLQEGDKSHTDIATFLESTRTHPTGILWTDCFIIPTMLAHQFMRAEREGDWILQQHCLKRMLPYFFVAGHHHYARATSAGIYELCSTSHLQPSRISSMVHTSAVTQKELLQCPATSTESRHTSNKENKPGD